MKKSMRKLVTQPFKWRVKYSDREINRSPIDQDLPFKIKGSSDLFTSLHEVRVIFDANISQLKLLDTIDFKMQSS